MVPPRSVKSRKSSKPRSRAKTPRNKRLVFVAHAEKDIDLAKALKAMLASALRIATGNIFVSSDVADMKVGATVRSEIDSAHASSVAILVLMTPNSMFRPWPMFEAGGGHFKGLPLFVVVANGLDPSCLPSPLRSWYAADISDSSAVRALVTAMAAKMGLPNANQRTKTISRVVNLASDGVGSWGFVSPTVAGVRLHRSPFNIDSIFEAKLPQHQLFLAGQCLNHITRRNNEGHYHDLFFRWLRRRKRRSIRILICDPKRRSMVNAWSSFVGEKYKHHLKHSVTVFKRWRKQARADKLDLDIRVVDFVSLTVTFVDPDYPQRGLLVLTPVIERRSANRPHFVAWSSEHPAIFDYYWTEYGFMFDDAGIPVEQR